MPNPAGPPGNNPSTSQGPYDPTQLPPSYWGYIDPNTPEGQRAHQDWLVYQQTHPGANPSGAPPAGGGQYPAVGGQNVNALGQITGYQSGLTPVFLQDQTAYQSSPQQDALYSRLDNAVSNLAPQNYAATAPSSTAAQGSAAQASAAQGSASGYGATTGNASGYSASTGNASGYGAATGNAAVYGAGSGKASAYDAATGGASNLAASSGQAATGNSAYVTGPATIGGAARSGYATADPTHISTAGDLAWQGQQQGLANTLATQANGGGVSPADLQLKQGTEQQIAGQLAVLGSQRGATDYGMAQRSASQGAATSEAQLNQQMGIQRAQETLQAQQALGNVLGTARGQAQNYNVNQADLLQALRLQNAGFAQQSGLANANLSQSAAEFNAGNAQAANIFNAGNAQQMTQANMAARNAMLSQNVSQAQAANQYSAGNSQQAMLANMLARNQANQFNAGQSQQMTSENLAAQNQAAMINANNSQSMLGQNLAAQNQAAQYNAGNAQQMQLQNLLAQNQANQFGAANSQGMQLANMSAVNQANQYNAGNAQQMTMADMLAQNQMTGQNLTAQNEFGLANLGNQQQTALANTSLAGQYGLSNQQAAMAAQDQYYKQLMGFTGAQMGQANQIQQNEIAYNQSLQNAALTQYGVDSGVAVSNAQTNANLTGAGISAAAGVTAAMIAAASDENMKTGIQGGNPMMDSFLEQYHAARSASPGVTDKGMDAFARLTSMARGGGLGAGIQNAGDSLAAGIKSFGQKLKADGTMAGANDAAAMGASEAANMDSSALAPQNLQGLGFGEGMGGPPQAGINSYDDMVKQLTGKLGWGEQQVPYTPASETMGMDIQPSVLAALKQPEPTLSDEREKKDKIQLSPAHLKELLSGAGQWNNPETDQSWTKSNDQDARYGELGKLHNPYHGSDDGYSTEYSIGVEDPRLNGGRPTNIPTLVKGQQNVDSLLRGTVTDEHREIAIQRALERQKAGAFLPSYKTWEDADKAATERSRGKGAEFSRTGDLSKLLQLPQQGDPMGSGYQPIEQQLAAPPGTLSDDREKEAVMSGNRGVQSFLEQANAQQTAQNQSGAQSNAFMQTGRSPSAQVDRQMPGDTSAGYGQMGAVNAPQFGGQFGGASVTGMGGFGGGGLSGEGGYQGGGWGPASQQSAGGWSPSSQTGNAYYNGAYGGNSIREAPASQQTTGTIAGAGEQGAGSYFTGGLSGMGGVGQGPSVSAGATRGGSNASAPPVFNVRNLGPDPATLAPARFPGFTAPAPVQPFNPRNVGPDPAAQTPASFPNFTTSSSPAPNSAPPPVSSPYSYVNGTASPSQLAYGIANISTPQGQANLSNPTTGLPSVDWNSVLAAAPPDASAGLIGTPQGQANLNNPTTGLGSVDWGSLLPGGANYVPQAPPDWVQAMGGAISDEREKTDIQNPDPAQLGDLLDHLHAHQYRYKDPSAPGAGAGTYVSPMAQELEQTDLGKNFVFQGPDGRKMIDYGKMAGTQLAATSMLHERVSGLEDLLKRSAATQPQGSR